MLYITEYKKNLLVSSLRIKKIENFLDEKLDFNLENGLLFSEYEKKQILIFKNFFRDWKTLLEINNYKIEEFVEDFEIFKKNKNSYYLYSMNSNSYHTDPKCELLNNDFKDYELDRNIPKEKLKEYKEWFRTKILEVLKASGIKDREAIQKTQMKFIQKKHLEKWGKEINFPADVNKKIQEI